MNIIAQPYEFFKEGGWSFLNSQTDDEDNSEDSDGEDVS